MSALLTGLLYTSFVYPYLAAFPTLFVLLLSMIAWCGLQFFFVTLFILVVYFYLDLRIFRRTKRMEDLLPDFLQIVSSNLKGGISFENALFGAIKPRFGVLANEMSEVSKKVMTGYDISIALKEFGEKYNSPMLARTVDLMVSEIESGGHVTEVIDNIVDSLKETHVLKEEISASVVTYTIFIGVIVVFISPLLFALSYHLLILVLGFVSKLSGATSNVTTTLFTIRDLGVNPDQFKSFSLGALAVISFFSSLIVSIIEKGSIKSGLKYIPIFLFGSLSLYFVFLQILTFLFKSITF